MFTYQDVYVTIKIRWLCRISVMPA